MHKLAKYQQYIKILLTNYASDNASLPRMADSGDSTGNVTTSMGGDRTLVKSVIRHLRLGD